jgi:hypothetical protein
LTMALQALLVIILVMAVLFVWRSSNRSKGLSGLATVLAVGAGLLLLKNPLLAAVAVVAVVLLINHVSSNKR